MKYAISTNGIDIERIYGFFEYPFYTHYTGKMIYLIPIPSEICLTNITSNYLEIFILG